MIQKKVCMLGASAVGKTSLVGRFVQGIFSDKYLTTVGVKIDKKKVSLDSGEMTLMLWDIYGQDEFQTIRDTYLRGATGYLLVADGTRYSTLDSPRSMSLTSPTSTAARSPPGCPARKRAASSAHAGCASS